MVDDDDQAEALVSYAASSSDSSEEETNAVQRMREIFLQERDSQRTANRGNVPMGGFPAPKTGRKNRFTLAKNATKRRGGRPAKK